MSRTNIQLGAIGVPIVIEIRDSDNAVETGMGSATGLKIYFQPPGGVTFVRTAVLFTDGSDGKIQYVTVAGDLSVPGRWLAQPEYTLSGFTGRGTDFSFKVEGNL